MYKNMIKMNNFSISYFHCPDCDMVMSVPRFDHRRREKDHIKDLYCPRCKGVKKMVENEIRTMADKEAKEKAEYLKRSY